MKKLTFLSIPVCLILLAAFIFLPSAKSHVKPYYSGDAINYRDTIVFGTANSGVFELFKVDGGKIVKLNSIGSDDNHNPDFLDSVFNIEGGRLFVYLVNGEYIYKYDITNPAEISIVKKVKDNAKDHFYGLNPAGDRIMTVGAKGVKIWNHDLETVNAYDLKIRFPRGIQMGEYNNYLINTSAGRLRVIDADYRDTILDTGLNTKKDHDRTPYNDRSDGAIYVTDDRSLSKYYLDGTVARFDHTGDFGYDVDGLDRSDYVYFSDGIGIVKIRKSDMKPVDWVYTEKLGSGNGWTVGLRVAANSSGEYILGFNGSSIILLNDRLEQLDFYAARDQSYVRTEKLYLKTGTNWGFSDDEVLLSGGGFGPNEELEINFAWNNFSAQTDNHGRFEKFIRVPNAKAGAYDFKVTGKKTKLTYSISFIIKDYLTP